MWTSGFGFTFCHQRRRVELKLRVLSFLTRLFFCGVKMTFHRVLSVVLVPTCWLFVSLADQATNPAVGSTAVSGPAVGSTAVSGPAVGSTAVSGPAVANSSRVNSTHSGGKIPGGVLDGSMIQRALYVLIGVTMIGVLYFLIRAVRLKRPSQKKKKYGLLSNYDDSVEMDGVESDEDDTLYEARSLRR